MPEAQPRDTNSRKILSALAAICHKHILMARSEDKGPNYFLNIIQILKFDLIAANKYYLISVSATNSNKFPSFTI